MKGKGSIYNLIEIKDDDVATKRSLEVSMRLLKTVVPLLRTDLVHSYGFEEENIAPVISDYIEDLIMEMTSSYNKVIDKIVDDNKGLI